jgi:hypothetical protein
MLYAACVPGFFIVAGMQFAIESPRWLAKVPLMLSSEFHLVHQDPSLYLYTPSCRLGD